MEGEVNTRRVDPDAYRKYIEKVFALPCFGKTLMSDPPEEWKSDCFHVALRIINDEVNMFGHVEVIGTRNHRQGRLRKTLRTIWEDTDSLFFCSPDFALRLTSKLESMGWRGYQDVHEKFEAMGAPWDISVGARLPDGTEHQLNLYNAEESANRKVRRLNRKLLKLTEDLLTNTGKRILQDRRCRRIPSIPSWKR